MAKVLVSGLSHRHIVEDASSLGNATQKTINSMIDRLARTSIEDGLTDQRITTLRKVTASLISRFQSNLDGMQEQFSSLLLSFQNQTLTQAKIESVFLSEQKRGFATLQLAHEVKNFLENIYTLLEEIRAAKGSKSTLLRKMDSIVIVLDQAMEAVVGISHVATVPSSGVIRAINLSHLEQTELRDSPERGYFTRKRLSLDYASGTSALPSNSSPNITASKKIFDFTESHDDTSSLFDDDDDFSSSTSSPRRKHSVAVDGHDAKSAVRLQERMLSQRNAFTAQTSYRARPNITRSPVESAEESRRRASPHTTSTKTDPQNTQNNSLQSQTATESVKTRGLRGSIISYPRSLSTVTSRAGAMSTVRAVSFHQPGGNGSDSGCASQDNTQKSAVAKRTQGQGSRASALSVSTANRDSSKALAKLGGGGGVPFSPISVSQGVTSGSSSMTGDSDGDGDPDRPHKQRRQTLKRGGINKSKYSLSVPPPVPIAAPTASDTSPSRLNDRRLEIDLQMRDLAQRQISSLTRELAREQEDSSGTTKDSSFGSIGQQPRAKGTTEPSFSFKLEAAVQTDLIVGIEIATPPIPFHRHEPSVKTGMGSLITSPSQRFGVDPRAHTCDSTINNVQHEQTKSLCSKDFFHILFNIFSFLPAENRGVEQLSQLPFLKSDSTSFRNRNIDGESRRSRQGKWVSPMHSFRFGNSRSNSPTGEGETRRAAGEGHNASKTSQQQPQQSISRQASKEETQANPENRAGDAVGADAKTPSRRAILDSKYSSRDSDDSQRSSSRRASRLPSTRIEPDYSHSSNTINRGVESSMHMNDEPDGVADKTLSAADLIQSQNPLLMVYDTFRDVFPELSKIRLLAAAAEFNSGGLNLLSRIFQPITETLEGLQTDVTLAQQRLSLCEELCRELRSKGGGSTTHQAPAMLYNAEFAEIVKECGRLTASNAKFQLLMCELRCIFEQVVASDLVRTPHFKSCESYRKSFKIFSQLQGDIASFTSDISKLKTVYHLLDASAQSEGVGGASPSPVNRRDPPREEPVSNGARRMSCDIQMRALEIQLEEANEEIIHLNQDVEHLNQSLFQTMQGKDRTPNALLFFSALQYDDTVPNLQQLVLQLSHLRDFVDGKEHIDFPTLRRRLQVSVECLPNVNRFVSRYTGLYGKWTKDRYKIFADNHRSLDEVHHATVCPLCNIDSRSVQVPSLTTDGSISIKADKRALNAPIDGSKGLRSGSEASVASLSTLESTPSLYRNSRHQPYRLHPVESTAEDNTRKVSDPGFATHGLGNHHSLTRNAAELLGDQLLDNEGGSMGAAGSRRSMSKYSHRIIHRPKYLPSISKA